MKLYFLELILTTKCNQKCNYCNVHCLNNKETILEIDLDFLKYILTLIPENTIIEFCGGEPGILSNLDEAFNIVNSNKNVKRIQIMSNGLVRKNNYEWLENDNVWYYEHLIKDLDGPNIIKFYDLDFIIKPRWKYVIVTTYKTINSLLLNYDYYKDLDMFNNRFWYKIMNPKITGVESFINQVELFFKKLKNDFTENYIDYTLDRINAIKNPTPYVMSKRRLCGMNSPQPTIDFETKELVHCGAFLEHSERFSFNKEIFLEHLYCNLFTNNYEYCETCYIYSDDTAKSIVSCRKGNFYNYEMR